MAERSNSGSRFRRTVFDGNETRAASSPRHGSAALAASAMAACLPGPFAPRMLEPGARAPQEWDERSEVGSWRELTSGWSMSTAHVQIQEDGPQGAKDGRTSPCSGCRWQSRDAGSRCGVRSWRSVHDVLGIPLVDRPYKARLARGGVMNTRFQTPGCATSAPSFRAACTTCPSAILPAGYGKGTGFVPRIHDGMHDSPLSPPAGDSGRAISFQFFSLPQTILGLR